jgi:hypothetical protein
MMKIFVSTVFELSTDSDYSIDDVSYKDILSVSRCIFKMAARQDLSFDNDWLHCIDKVCVEVCIVEVIHHANDSFFDSRVIFIHISSFHIFARDCK